VANGESASSRIVSDAAARTARGLRQARSSRQAFEILSEGLGDIDLVIIDVDPGLHALSMLEALSYMKSAPPVIVVTSLEETEMKPIACRHGATACIGKPFTSNELAALIAEICPLTSGPPANHAGDIPAFHANGCRMPRLFKRDCD
jgi:DNA-binding response OmpR family regulator